MAKKELSLETIERWLKDGDWRVRAAAMNACQGKDVPLETIERGLKDGDCDVRAAAMNACKANGMDIPIIRTVEPPETVYKKCFGGVIVCAHIPEDAQIRGTVGRKCRANKAVITGVIGTLGGEPVGISLFDKKTTYYEGDEIEIENFDFSNEECSAGFHFFCTKAEAEEYTP
nr:MAG TPA: non-SMC mitotic condensation complex subunit 1 [Caudoviricetes sp.]